MVGQVVPAAPDVGDGRLRLAMSVGFMIAFPLVGAVVLSQRLAGRLGGHRRRARRRPRSAGVAAGPRRPRRAIGEEMDGGDGADDARPVPRMQATLGEALAHARVLGVCRRELALRAGRVGHRLFNESILAERGFAPDVYHQALAITAITGLAGNFVAGAWAERGSLRQVLVAAMLVLSGGAHRRCRTSAPTLHVDGAGGGDGRGRRVRDGGVLQLLGPDLRRCRTSAASRAPRRR